MKETTREEMEMGDEEKPKLTISINPPPQDGRCEVCGKHASEVKPFGGPGDPLVGDFTGARLLKNFRNIFPVSMDLITERSEFGKSATCEGHKFKAYLRVGRKEIRVDGYIQEELWECTKQNEKAFNEYTLREDKKKEFLEKYGTEAYRKLHDTVSMMLHGISDTISASWECRDCICLSGWDAFFRSYKKFEVTFRECCELDVEYHYGPSEHDLEVYLEENLWEGIAVVSIKEVPNDYKKREE